MRSARVRSDTVATEVTAVFVFIFARIYAMASTGLADVGLSRHFLEVVFVCIYAGLRFDMPLVVLFVGSVFTCRGQERVCAVFCRQWPLSVICVCMYARAGTGLCYCPRGQTGQRGSMTSGNAPGGRGWLLARGKTRDFREPSWDWAAGSANLKGPR